MYFSYKRHGSILFVGPFCASVPILTLCLSTLLPPTHGVPRPRIAGSGLFGLDCFKTIVIDH